MTEKMMESDLRPIDLHPDDAKYKRIAYTKVKNKHLLIEALPNMNRNNST
jgi:hypothetical protein